MARNIWAQFPKKILGHKCSHYRKTHTEQILDHYNIEHWSGTKKYLLRVLTIAESKLSEDERSVVRDWMNQWPTPRQSLEEYLVEVRSYEGSEDQRSGNSDDDIKDNSTCVTTPDTMECAVCMEPLEEGKFPNGRLTSSCNHELTTCTSCLIQGTESQINDKSWDQITYPECPALLSFELVKALVSPHVFERYDRKSVVATFEHMPNFTMCLGPGCDSGQIHGGGDDQPIMTCTTCKFKTCFTHKVAWHVGQTCAEYEASQRERFEQEEASEKVLGETTKKCPNRACGVICVKVSGCDHITCHRCSHEYCWICAEPYAPIREYGNSRHALSCTHHEDNLPPVPPEVTEPDYETDDEIIDEPFSEEEVSD